MNSSPKRPPLEPGSNWRKAGGTITFWAIILLIMVFFSRAFDSKPAEEHLNYTEYRTLIGQADPGIRNMVVISDDVAPVLKGERAVANAEGAPENRKFSVILPPEFREEMTLWDQKGIPYTFEERKTNWAAYLATTILPWIVLFGIWIFIMRRMQGGGGNKGVFSFGKSRAKMMNETQVKVTFKDVAGADEAKEELREIIEFLKDPKRFSRLGGRIPKGALMLGPPGTGKTLLARAVAGEAGVPFFSMSGADFVEMFVGVGASRVRDLFEQGKKSAPCIIFIDEIDAVGRQRGAGLGGGHDEREQTLNQLLVEMDGFESNEGVILIAATNRPDVLDPALLRPGRFDRQIVVDRPDVRGREGILKVHARKVPLEDDVNLTTMAKGTPGLAGADLANLVNEAALLAARRNKQKVGMSEFEEARDKVLMGTARKSLLLTEDDKRITAYHEAGHALISKLLPQANPLHKVTIIPRGRALGLTWQLPEDKVHQSRGRLLAELRVLYGGREAEKLVFDDITTGASNDIKRATQIAEAMVCDVGMSEALGLRNYGKKQEEIFLGREIAQHRDFSERTAELIDSEINRILEEARLETARLLRDNRDKLDLLAEALLIHEILDADEIVRILSGEILAAPVRVPEPDSAAGGAGESGPALPGPELEPLSQPGVA
ncbi:MAG: ATP-dependent zinc metalloprotease FtsH [Candidatus Delongbacteria bacterium]